MGGKTQELFVEPPSTFITSFSFTVLNGGVILVRAGVNDYTDSLNFILDTGSGGISLDSATVKDLGIPITPSEKTIKGIGGIRKVSFLNNATLRLPGLAVENLNFHVNDYEILTSVYGIKIDGIIGYSFFSQYIVNINYDFLQINVFSKGSTNIHQGDLCSIPCSQRFPCNRFNSQMTENLFSGFTWIREPD